jgi:Cu+-exporting ATPase
MEACSDYCLCPLSSCFCAQGADCGCFEVKRLRNVPFHAFSVEGMTCDGCIGTIESALTSVNAHASLVPPFCVVWGEGEKAMEEASDVGFVLRPLGVVFLEIKGITCSSCTDTLENVLRGVKDVFLVRVELEGRAFVLGTDLNPDSLIEACSDVGYSAIVSVNGYAQWGTGMILSYLSKRADGAATPEVATNGLSLPESVSLLPADQELLFSIEGMRCAACVSKIERAVSRIAGVSSASVNLMSKALRVTAAAAKFLGEDAVLEAVRNVGYEAKRLETGASTVILRLDGSVVDVDREALVIGISQMEGVVSARFDEGELVVVFVSSAVMKVRDVVYLVRDRFGVVCHPVSPFERMNNMLASVDEIRDYRRAFLWSLVFFVPTMLIGMIFMWIDVINHFLMRPVFAGATLSISALVLFLLATPVQFWLGKRFHVAAFRAAQHRSLTMDTLVSLGTFFA